MSPPLVNNLFTVLKRRLKTSQLTYRDLAAALDISTDSVKRRFSLQNLTFEQLTIVAKLLGVTMTDLMKESEEPPVRYLTAEQEKRLMADKRLFLVARCILCHWTMADIVENYDFTEAECLKYLYEMESLGLISVLLNNQVRLRVPPDIEAPPGGPLYQFARGHVLRTFFAEKFDDQYDRMMFMRGMLTPAAVAEFQEEARRLKRKLALLHEESLQAPFEERINLVCCLVQRHGELAEFAAMRRQPEGVRPELSAATSTKKKS